MHDTVSVCRGEGGVGGGVDAVWVLCCMSAVGTVVVSFFLGVPGRVGAACGLL